jgi:hypothetical protein
LWIERESDPRRPSGQIALAGGNLLRRRSRIQTGRPVMVFPSYEEGVRNGPEPSRARRCCAAKRTLDGEDRSGYSVSRERPGESANPARLTVKIATRHTGRTGHGLTPGDARLVRPISQIVVSGGLLPRRFGLKSRMNWLLCPKHLRRERPWRQQRHVSLASTMFYILTIVSLCVKYCT